MGRCDNLFLTAEFQYKIKTVENKVLKVKNLTYCQQSNNTILTTKQELLSDLCRVINWLFIILVLVSYKNAGVLLDTGIFYFVVFINERTAALKALGCSTFTT